MCDTRFNVLYIKSLVYHVIKLFFHANNCFYLFLHIFLCHILEYSETCMSYYNFLQVVFKFQLMIPLVYFFPADSSLFIPCISHDTFNVKGIVKLELGPDTLIKQRYNGCNIKLHESISIKRSSRASIVDRLNVNRWQLFDRGSFI